jgi:putative lipoprotein
VKQAARKSVHGAIVLPAEASKAGAKNILVEVRDVSVIDAPSTVVASKVLKGKKVSAGTEVPFTLEMPSVAPNRRLELRVHVDMSGNGQVTPGDYLTTESIAVPHEGTTAPLSVRVKKV